MDLVLAGLVGAAANEAVSKIIGPTSELLGNAIKDFTLARVENVRKIANVAIKKAKNINDETLFVHPSIVKDIIDEGSLRDDEIIVEYLGGILAASRTGSSRDDRGLKYTAIIKSMSAYEIRLHFILYAAIRSIFEGRIPGHGDVSLEEKANMGISYGLRVVHFGQNELACALALDETERPHGYSIAVDALSGLSRLGLIADFTIESPESFKVKYSKWGLEQPHATIRVVPSITGFALMMQAFGHSNMSVLDFFEHSYEISTVGDLPAAPFGGFGVFHV